MSKIFLKYVIFLTVLVSGLAPAIAAQNSSLLAFSKKSNSTLQRYDTLTTFSRKQAADSSVTRVSIWIEGKDGTQYVKVELAEDQQNLIITAYNLLGKKVLDIHQGGEKAGSPKDYAINTASIPSGIYICVVQGDNFRLAEKFFVSK